MFRSLEPADLTTRGILQNLKGKTQRSGKQNCGLNKNLTIWQRVSKDLVFRAPLSDWLDSKLIHYANELSRLHLMGTLVFKWVDNHIIKEPKVGSGSFHSLKTSISIVLSKFANQWTGFYMIGISVMKELIKPAPLQ